MRASRRAPWAAMRHVILLVGRGRGASRSTQGVARCLFSLISAAVVTSAIIRPELRPGSGVRKGGRSWLSVGIDHQRDAPLRDGADLGDGQRDLSAAKATGSAWKLPPETISPALDQHQRVVGGGVRLDLQRARGLAQHVDRGAGHLRLAADAVGVLHARIAVAVAFADLRAVQQGAIMAAATSIWPRMAAQLVDLAAQRRGGAHDRVGRQRRRDDQRCGAARQRAEQAGQREGGRDLRAVDQRQPLLGGRARAAAALPRRAPRRRHRFAVVARPRPRRSAPRPYGRAARGRREAPTEPCAGMTGSDVLAPACPRSARTTSQPHAGGAAAEATAASAPSSAAPSRGSTDSPTPQQCDRIRLRCRVAVSSGRILIEASLPKPVLTP